MQSLEEAFERACSDGVIPGAVIAAVNKTGTFKYEKSFGVRSVEEGKDARLKTDTLMTLASCSKLITTIAVLQLVERGQIGLDDDTAHLLPELAKMKIINGMKDGKPDLLERKNPITLRHLLTHSSGLAYPFESPLLVEYIQSITTPGSPPPPKTVVGTYSLPGLFEPGTSWTYSHGLDWAGLLVSRLSELDLDNYFQKYIFAPLDIKDITFWPDRQPELAARVSDLFVRDPALPDGSGKAVAFKGPNMVAGATEEMGGQGVFGSLTSYLKILHSLLVDDEKLLKKETAKLMFEPQLSEESREELQRLYASSPKRGPISIGNFPPSIKYDWGLGGLLTMEDVKEDGQIWRRKRCLNWSGMFNCFWFLDREAGICGVYGSQLLPSGDRQIKTLMSLFERTMYEQNTGHGKL